jgi:hypothetical protein
VKFETATEVQLLRANVGMVSLQPHRLQAARPALLRSESEGLASDAEAAP